MVLVKLENLQMPRRKEGKSQLFKAKRSNDLHNEVQFLDANLLGLTNCIKNPDGIRSTFWVQRIGKYSPGLIQAGQTIHQSTRGYFLTTCYVVMYVDTMLEFPVI